MFPASKAMRDGTGSLDAIAKLLDPCEPTLVFLANANGDVIVVDAIGSDSNLEEADLLAGDLSSRLVDAETSPCDAPNDFQGKLAFAVRLGDDAGRGILGGVSGNARS